MVDEGLRVGRPAALPAKPVLERRERTDPPREHDPHTPGHRGNVQARDAGPSHDENATENHEQHERDMEDDRGVGQDAEDHVAIMVSAGSSTGVVIMDAARVLEESAEARALPRK